METFQIFSGVKFPVRIRFVLKNKIIVTDPAYFCGFHENEETGLYLLSDHGFDDSIIFIEQRIFLRN